MRPVRNKRTGTFVEIYMPLTYGLEDPKLPMNQQSCSTIVSGNLFEVLSLQTLRFVGM